MADDLDNTIRENAQGPAEAHGDSGGMKQHSLKDQIEADRKLDSGELEKQMELALRSEPEVCEAGDALATAGDSSGSSPASPE